MFVNFGKDRCPLCGVASKKQEDLKHCPICGTVFNEFSIILSDSAPEMENDLKNTEWWM